MFLEQDPYSIARPGRRPAGDPSDALCGARLAGRPGGLADSAGRAGRVRALPADSPLTPAALLRTGRGPARSATSWVQETPFLASPTLTINQIANFVLVD